MGIYQEVMFMFIIGDSIVDEFIFLKKDLIRLIVNSVKYGMYLNECIRMTVV